MEADVTDRRRSWPRRSASSRSSGETDLLVAASRAPRAAGPAVHRPPRDRGDPGVLGLALCGVAGVAGGWSRCSGHGQVRGAARSGVGQSQYPVESARLRGRLLEPPLASGRPGHDDVDDRDALQACVLQGPTDRAGDVACPQPARLTVAEPITVSGTLASPPGRPARRRSGSRSGPRAAPAGRPPAEQR